MAIQAKLSTSKLLQITYSTFYYSKILKSLFLSLMCQIYADPNNQPLPATCKPLRPYPLASPSLCRARVSGAYFPSLSLTMWCLAVSPSQLFPNLSPCNSAPALLLTGEIPA
jgi:hypothetical protein